MIKTEGNIEAQNQEGEERNAPVAKLVKASDFQSDNRQFESGREYKNDMNCWGKNIVKTDTIDGRAFSRLSVF